jgi:hypothetical protein
MDWKGALIAGGSIVGKAACMHVHGTKNTSTGVLVMGRNIIALVFWLLDGESGLK